MDRSIVGTWRLVSWQNRTVSGEVSYPLGRNAEGLLSYTEGGRMWVAVARAQRHQFAGSDLLGGTVEERALASGSYVAYCGSHAYD